MAKLEMHNQLELLIENRRSLRFKFMRTDVDAPHGLICLVSNKIGASSSNGSNSLNMSLDAVESTLLTMFDN